MGVKLIMDDRKPIAPVVLPVIAENPQRGFHSLICPLTLPVCFGIICRTHVLLNSQLFTNFSKQLAGEPDVSVTDQFAGDSDKRECVFLIKVSQLLRPHCFVAWY